MVMQKDELNNINNITASDIYAFFRPSKCNLRVYLDFIGEKKCKTSPYEKVIRDLGKKHEQAHLETLESVKDLSTSSLDESIKKTNEYVKQGVEVIFQGALQAKIQVNGRELVLTGIPDFLIKNGNSYTIRDSKIARRINEQDHPEIIFSLWMYGLLFENVFKKKPAGLEVHSGNNELVSIHEVKSLLKLGKVLDEMATYRRFIKEPYSPVGWTKCSGCYFHEHCWSKAEKRKDPALIYGVDQGLAVELNKNGINSIDDFVKKYDSKEISEIKRPLGKGFQRVGERADSILRSAYALKENREIIIGKPNIPDYPNYVIFDLEGLPPQLDEVNKIYLWGTQVFGKRPGEFQGALAGFNKDGDKDGWKNFLDNSKSIFLKYGDIPFIHWHHYEKVHVKCYIDRFGDIGNVGARVLENLLDILPITQRTVVLPLSSYSLKEVEKYVGFKRTQSEYGGDWAMAKFIEATESKDEKVRQKYLDEIILYNKEDLEATWVVFKWLKQFDL